MPSPHETLGVASNASIEEVRAAYIQLARRHHPDKHGHATEEERARNEAIFKEVTNAYQLIAERPSYAQATSEEAWRVPTSLDEWESTWNKVINVPEVMNTMKSLFNMAKQMREARLRAAKAAESPEPQEPIHATLQVTPADVQGMRKRKIRILPSSASNNTVTVLVDCGAFPGPFCDAMTNVEVAFEIVSNDAHGAQDVTVDSFEPGKWDLFRRVSVNLMQWLEGSVHALPHVCLNNTAPLNVVIPPCTPLDAPLIYDDATQWRYGSIYVTVSLDLPTQDAWNALGAADRQMLATLLRTLSQPAPVP
jgi:hypothetical protein